MTASSSNWGESVMPGIRSWVDDGYEQYDPYYTKLLNVDTSDRQFVDDINSTGIGRLDEVGEAGATTYEDPLQGYKTRYTQRVFKKGIQVTREEHKWDMYNLWEKRSRKLGEAGARTKDYFAIGDMFRNAFNTANTSYGDGLPLCSTLHTRIDGGSTQSNASATGIALTEPNLEVALLAQREVLDDKGQLVDFMTSKPILMVSPYLKKTALEIVGSDRRSGTANNDLNYYFEHEDVDVFVNPWLSALSTGSTRGSGTDLYWFIIAKGQHELNFIQGTPFDLESDKDFDTDVMKIKAYETFAYGWSDWRGTWGSKGDGVAYSS